MSGGDVGGSRREEAHACTATAPVNGLEPGCLGGYDFLRRFRQKRSRRSRPLLLFAMLAPEPRRGESFAPEVVAGTPAAFSLSGTFALKAADFMPGLRDVRDQME